MYITLKKPAWKCISRIQATTQGGLMRKLIVALFILSIPALLVIDSCKKNDSIVNPLTPVLTLSDTTLTFEAGQSQRMITITNSGEGELLWNLQRNSADAWLTVTPDSGTTGTQMTITVDPKALVPGSHSSWILVKSNGGDKKVSILVLIPKLHLSVRSTNFSASENTKTIQISNEGAGRLNWSLSESPDIGWLSEDITFAEYSASIILTVDRAGIATGNQHGMVIISSAGGADSVQITMTRLPSSNFVEEFDTDLNNWIFTDASATLTNGFLEINGTTSGSYGTAAHAISPLKSEPWAYRLSYGRKFADSALCKMVMYINDQGTLTIPVLSFDIGPYGGGNWQAMVYAYNNSTASGRWAILTDDSRGMSPRIKTDPNMMNDITWAVSGTKNLEIYVDGELFYQSNIFNEVGVPIEVGLESIEIWAQPYSTTSADWVLVRDVSNPELQNTAPRISTTHAMIRQQAKAELMRITRDDAWDQLPTMKEVLVGYR